MEPWFTVGYTESAATASARKNQEENKLVEAGFEFMHYNEKDEVAIYRKRK